MSPAKRPSASRDALPADLPARGAEEAVRRLALAELARAERAREALVEGDRDEALHDLRVAVRRLRSLLRSHRSEFSSGYPRKLVKRLGELASSTSPGRDAEVQVAWLTTLTPKLKPAEKPGHLALLRQLEERRDDCYRKVEREVVRDFGELAAKLRERLVAYRVELRLDESRRAPSFATATGGALARAAADLLEKLDAIRSAGDEAEGHAARIAAKRLRYLAEPLAPWAAEAKPPVARLKRLQDLLGELHDGQLLAAHVSSALAEIESRRAQALVEATLGGAPSDAATDRVAARDRPAGSSRRARAGLLAVARALGERRNELFAAIAAGWLGAEAPERAALATDLDRLAARLAAPASSWRRRRSRISRKET